MMSVPRLRAASLAVLAVLLSSACGGPREPLEVGVREVASDIVLGTQGRKAPAPTIAPIPPAPVAVAIPTPVRLPAPPRFEPTPTPTPTPQDPCPEAHPLSVPRQAATDNEGAPPVEESFEFGNVGQFAVTGPNANEGTFSGLTPRAITNVDGGPGEDITYDVEAELAGTTTRSSYLMRNVSPIEDPFGVVAQANLDEQRGLYLTRVLSTLPDGTEVDFRPANPLRLLRFPVRTGDTFDEVGTDPTSGTVMQFTATVLGPARVDACGEFIEAIEVELTDGQVNGPNQSVEFTATYAIATQYGGLIVRDAVTTRGTEGADTVTRTNIATITKVPTHHTEVTS